MAERRREGLARRSRASVRRHASGSRGPAWGVLLLALLYGSAVLAPLLASDRPWVLVAANERAYERARRTLPVVVDELLAEDGGGAADLRAVHRRLDVLRAGAPPEAARRVDAFEERLAGARGGGPGVSGEVRRAAAELAAASVLEHDGGDVVLAPVTTFPLLAGLSWLDAFLVAAWATAVSAPLWWRRRRRAGLVAGSAVAVVAALAAAASEAADNATKAGIDAGDFAVELVLFPPIPYGFAETHLDEELRPPTWTGPGAERAAPLVRVGEPGAGSRWRHLLGTDPLGRDVLARLLWGARLSLSVGLVAAALLVGIGVVLGGLAGYFGGGVDFAFLRVVEVMQSFPAFLLTLTGVVLVPSRALHPMLTIAFVIALVGWTGVARLVRAELLRLRELDSTTAARALGLPPLRIAFRHLLPAALPPVLVAGAFATSNAVLTESAISFLGLGIGPPTPSWGALIAVERDAGAWWLQLFPGLMVFLTVVAYNLVGEGLREALDPVRAAGGPARPDEVPGAPTTLLEPVAPGPPGARA